MDRSSHLIEAVPDRLEGAPVARQRRCSDEFKTAVVIWSLEPTANVSVLAREIGYCHRSYSAGGPRRPSAQCKFCLKF